MQIKTLAEILAESDTDSASSAVSKKRSSNKQSSKKAKLTDTERFNLRKSKTAQRSNSKASDDDSDNSFTNQSVATPSINDGDSSFFSDDLSSPEPPSKLGRQQSKKDKKRKKYFHAAATFVPEPNDTPAYVAPEAQTIQQMLAEVKRDVHNENASHHNHANPLTHIDNQINADCEFVVDQDNIVDSSSPDPVANDYIDNLTTSELDNLPSALKAYLRTPEQKQAEIDAVKAESRLRWLAFYYLSRREYGKAELKQKLIDKEQDSDKIDELLAEFEEKGYQSDYRTTLMLIRENIRKGRGRQRIKQEFYKKKVDMPDNIDELIDMANSESEEFSEFVDDNEDSLVAGVDWLKLAVEARTKKYGDGIPTEQKEKAKQLRFLQYRGFQMDICFQALNYTLDTLEERF